MIGHLFHTALSFMHHFKAMSEFRLELLSGKAQFGSQMVIFLSSGQIIKMDTYFTIKRLLIINEQMFINLFDLFNF